MLRVTIARKHVLLVHFIVAEKLVTDMIWGRNLLGPSHLDCVIDLGSKTLFSRHLRRTLDLDKRRKRLSGAARRKRKHEAVTTKVPHQPSAAFCAAMEWVLAIDPDTREIKQRFRGATKAAEWCNGDRSTISKICKGTAKQKVHKALPILSVPGILEIFWQSFSGILDISGI